MKHFTLLIVVHFLFTVTIYCQNASKKFYTIQKHFTDDNLGGSFDSIYFYKANSKVKLFSFCKKYQWGDCNSMGYEWGKYSVSNDTITCYSLYGWQGSGNSQPFGVRKIIYKLTENGAIQLSNNMFLEHRFTTGVSEWIDGVRYILEKPTNKQQEEQLNTYVNHVEKKWGGTFVLHEEAKVLIKDVRAHFANIISTNTKTWKKAPEPYNKFKL